MTNHRPGADLVATTLTAIVHSWIEDGDAPDAVTIDTGLCADFANDAAGRILKATGIDPIIVSFQDHLLSDPDGSTLPPGIDMPLLMLIDGYANVSHTWLFAVGRHYDAETPNGVANPCDLPCIRHALAELVELHSPETYRALIADHAWWTETRRIREVRESFMQPDAPPCP